MPILGSISTFCWLVRQQAISVIPKFGAHQAPDGWGKLLHTVTNVANLPNSCVLSENSGPTELRELCKTKRQEHEIEMNCLFVMVYTTLECCCEHETILAYESDVPP